MLCCSRFPTLVSPTRFAALGLAAFGTVHPAFTQTAVLTQSNDNARSGSNTAETILAPQNVKVATFGKLFTITGLNANVNGQVLYVPGVSIGGAKHNVVYAYTSNNADNSPNGVYVCDGDTGTQLWKRSCRLPQLIRRRLQSLTRRQTCSMCCRSPAPTILA